MLGNSLGFTPAAVGAIALGIGVNSQLDVPEYGVRNKRGDFEPQACVVSRTVYIMCVEWDHCGHPPAASE